MSKKRIGKIIISPNTEIWPHELRTAKALANAGYIVEFLMNKNITYQKSPDVLIDGEKWEFKSPKADKLSSVERNLKKATKQSGNIVIDSQRLGKIHDASVLKLLVTKYKQQKTINKLIFVNRKRKVVDLNALL